MAQCKHGWTEEGLRAHLAEAEALLARCIAEEYPMKAATVAGQQRAVATLRAHLAEIGEPLESSLAAVADMEYSTRIDADRVTLEFGSKSARRLDSGKRPITDSPLFGGPAQGDLW
jgi:hypothetical protein